MTSDANHCPHGFLAIRSLMASQENIHVMLINVII